LLSLAPASSRAQVSETPAPNGQLRSSSYITVAIAGETTSHLSCMTSRPKYFMIVAGAVQVRTLAPYQNSLSGRGNKYVE